MSGCEELLKQIAEMFDCKVWVCEKVGRRINHIPNLKAGRERFVPPTVAFEDENYVVFVEADGLNEELIKLCEKVVECVRCARKNRSTSRTSDA